MSYQVKQGNIFGRVGQNFAEGLGATVPKEVERARLSNALQDVKSLQNATPFEQFAAVAPYMKDNPQLLQNTTELLRQQGIRNAYGQSRQGRLTGQQDQSGQNIPANDPRNVEFLNRAIQQQQQPTTQPPEQIVPKGFASRAAEVVSSPPAARENPLSQKYLPPPAFTPQMRERAITEAFDRGIATTFPEANAYADQQERYYNNAPQAERANYEYKRGIDNEVNNLFDADLQTRLQKEKGATYEDIPGDLQEDLKKQARNSVATGEYTPREAAEYYTKAALDLSKDAKLFKTLSNPSFDEQFIPSKKNERLKSFMNIGKNYQKYKAGEQYYNMLIDDQNGPGLSPGNAAALAFPRSAPVKQIINNARFTSEGAVKSRQQAANIADQILNKMAPDDSLQAIARELSVKYPAFDEASFFDYIRDNEDRWPKNPNFSREVTQGVSKIFSRWGDVILFPATGTAPVFK